MTTEFKLEVTDGFDSVLEDLANKKSTTKEEIIKNALAVYAHLQQQLKKHQGSHLVIREGNEILQKVELP